MAYIVGKSRNQVQFVSVSLDDLIGRDNPVRVIDAYVDSLDLVELGFTVYDGTHKGHDGVGGLICLNFIFTAI